MDINQQKRLETAGWKVGTAEEFLGLTQEDIEAINKAMAKRSPQTESNKEW